MTGTGSLEEQGREEEGGDKSRKEEGWEVAGGYVSHIPTTLTCATSTTPLHSHLPYTTPLSPSLHHSTLTSTTPLHSHLPYTTPLSPPLHHSTLTSTTPLHSHLPYTTPLSPSLHHSTLTFLTPLHSHLPYTTPLSPSLHHSTLTSTTPLHSHLHYTTPLTFQALREGDRKRGKPYRAIEARHTLNTYTHLGTVRGVFFIPHHTRDILVRALWL